jgi:hypothetical protein
MELDLKTEGFLPKYRIAYYSSIPCAPTFGGPVQIYRHFRERHDFEFIDLNGPDQDLWENWIGRRIANSFVFQRLLRTRLFPWLLAFASVTLRRSEVGRLVKRVAAARAHAVVTVAYGRNCYVARDAAKQLDLPLITFFHDWWPDLVYSKTQKSLRWLDREFKKLANDSDLIFPVTHQISVEVGNHSNAVILPPISGLREAVSSRTDCGKNDNRPLVVYLGTLQGNYGAMARSLGEAFLSIKDCSWRLRLYGSAGDWTEDTLRRFEEAGIYGGAPEHGAPVEEILSGADVLLVVMDFLPEYQRRSRTSFPSKILEYASFSKPMVVWGPDASTAAEFVRENSIGLAIDSQDPLAFLGELGNWLESCNLPDLGMTVDHLYKERYTPDRLHQIVVKSINDIIFSRC